MTPNLNLATRESPARATLADLGIEPPNVTVKEAVALGRFGVTFLYARINSGDIETKLIGGRRMVVLASLRAFLSRESAPVKYVAGLKAKAATKPINEAALAPTSAAEPARRVVSATPPAPSASTAPSAPSMADYHARLRAQRGD